MRPKLLDLYACEGAAGMGYSTEFDVYAVDLFKYRDANGRPKGFSQKRNPFPSWQGDALLALDILTLGGELPFILGRRLEMLRLEDFAAIHASPPCQRYSITNAARGADYPDLIAPTRERLRETGLPYIIENVEGAPLEDPVTLCGCMFDLKARDDDGIMLYLERPRLFESNIALTPPKPCEFCGKREWVGGCYGGARRDKYEAKYVRKGGYVPPNIKVVQELMGIDWMTWGGMHQAIPPAYTAHLAGVLAAHLSDTDSTEAVA